MKNEKCRKAAAHFVCIICGFDVNSKYFYFKNTSCNKEIFK